MADIQTLIEQYRKTARLADDRLRLLEKTSKEPRYKGILTFAYKAAMRDVKYWRGGDATRFGKGKSGYAGLSEEQIRAKIRDMELFIHSPSASKKGMKQVYINRADSLNKLIGFEGQKDAPTWQQWADFLGSDAFKELQDSFVGSNTMIDVLAQFIRQKDVIKNAIEQNDYTHIKIQPDTARNSAIEFLQENGIALIDMF